MNDHLNDESIRTFSEFIWYRRIVCILSICGVYKNKISINSLKELLFEINNKVW